MSVIRIGDRSVGDGQPVYVVAEAGSNHNGSFEHALRLIDAAVDAGADAVKFQNFKARRLYPRSAGESDYLKVQRSIYDIIEQMEMPDDWIPRLAEYCRDRDIEFLSSAFDEATADALEPYVSAFKVASYELTHLPLVEHMARFGKPMIVSTGAAILDEVLGTVDAIVETGNDQIILLQCTASYPAPLETVNARAILALKNASGRPVGLSDHSRDPIIAPTIAVALGACMIEKHFTLSNRLPGPDHKFAVEPDELAALVKSVHDAEAALGSGAKVVQGVEDELRTFARRSIFTLRPLTAGEILSPDNIAVLRCGKIGYGLPPETYPELLGRVVSHDIAAERPIVLDDLK